NRNIDINEVLPVQLIERIIKAKQVTAVSDDELEKVIMQVISENQKAIEDYKKGKEQVMGFLVGQVLRQMKGKGDTQKISAIIKRLIV
ncbi:GatB/YqeY domain-containing protein, partial [Candidatus Gottesmanbacteria bacterium]|nr:GatB/YqeY domain-containing protein [Candidatus Gottesmanbacteria bacterium]